MKRLLSLLLCIALLAALAPTIGAADLKEDIFSYTVEGGEAILTGVLENPEELYLPETLGGYPLTTIKVGAIKNLTSRLIILPQNITKLNTFSISQCPNAEVYVLAKDVQCNGYDMINAFRIYGYDREIENHCYSEPYYPLQEYPEEPWTLEYKSKDGITYAIRDGEAFVTYVSLRTEYIIPETLEGCPVTRIAPYCLQGAQNGTKIVFPDTVRSIGRSVISDWYNGEPIQLPKALEYVGNYAFFETPVTGSLKTLRYIGDAAFASSGLTEIDLGENLIEIGSNAFDGHSDNEITIPASVQKIGYGPFSSDAEGSRKLTLTVLNPETICEDAFFGVSTVIGYYGSTAMTEAESAIVDFVDIETGERLIFQIDIEALRYYVFLDHAEVAYAVDQQTQYELYFIEEMIEGRPVSVIRQDSLRDLQSNVVVMPDTVRVVEEYAFQASHVQEVVMSQNIETIEGGAFDNCHELRLICWPDNAHEIVIAPDWAEMTDLFAHWSTEDVFFVTKPGSKVEKFAKNNRYNVLPLGENMEYFTDGEAVYSTDGKEVIVHAVFYHDGSDHSGEYIVADTAYGIPVTKISADAHWDDEIVRVYLGNRISTVGQGAFTKSKIRELVANQKVEALPHPLFAEGIFGSVYGYGGSYAERFCKEHGYKFYPIDTVPFKDVKNGDWYFDSVYYCYMTGLMNGTSETSFAPQATTTRAMLAQVLYNMSGAPSHAWQYSFTDVKTSDWFAKAVHWCRHYELAFGTSENTFSPNQNVTREQVATFLYRYAQACNVSTAVEGELSKFTDSHRVSTYANAALRWAVGNGIINGQTPTTLNPQGQATRAEIATMLMRFVQYVDANK